MCKTGFPLAVQKAITFDALRLDLFTFYLAHFLKTSDNMSHFNCSSALYINKTHVTCTHKQGIDVYDVSSPRA